MYLAPLFELLRSSSVIRTSIAISRDPNTYARFNNRDLSNQLKGETDDHGQPKWHPGRGLNTQSPIPSAVMRSAGSRSTVRPAW